MIDELGHLHWRMEAMKPVAARYEQLRGQLLDWHKDVPSDLSFTLEGADFTVEVSACAEQRRIASIRTVQKLLGADFWNVCTVPLSAIDERVPRLEQDKLVVKTHTGPRRLTIVPKMGVLEKAS